MGTPVQQRVKAARDRYKARGMVRWDAYLFPDELDAIRALLMRLRKAKKLQAGETGY